MHQNKWFNPFRRFLLTLFLLIFTIPSTRMLAEDLDVIEDPKPTHTASKFLKLVPFKDIRDIDEHQFLARPSSLAVDDEGSIYIYDQLLKKIIKLNHEFKWERSFGRQGRGPGEFTGNDWGYNKLYFAQDGNLYVTAPHNKKLIVFDKKGKLVKEIRLPNSLSNKTFYPVVDKLGELYSYSQNEGAIDVFNNEMELTCTLLTQKEFQRFLFYPVIRPAPFPKSNTSSISPSMSNTYYDLLPGGELIIFITYSSRAYIFKDNKLINQFDFWPQKALRYYKQLNAEDIKKNKNGSRSNINLIYHMFPDLDEPGYFYLFSFPGANIYKVNLEGKLIQAYDVVGGNFRIASKRHGLFYGFDMRNEHVRIFKIKKEMKK